MIPSSYLGWATLDSRLRGNDGVSAPKSAEYAPASPSREKGGRWIQFGFDFRRLSCPRFLDDDVVGRFWIPAFAGMTGLGTRGHGRDLSLAIRAWFAVARFVAPLWIPAFEGMTGLGAREHGRDFIARDSRLGFSRVCHALMDSRLRGNDGVRGKGTWKGFYRSRFALGFQSLGWSRALMDSRLRGNGGVRDKGISKGFCRSRFALGFQSLGLSLPSGFSPLRE